MSISFFMTFTDAAGERRIHADDLATAAGMIGTIPHLTEGLLFTPLDEPIEHPYKQDGRGPVLALQLRFADLFAANQSRTCSRTRARKRLSRSSSDTAVSRSPVC